MGPEEPVQVLVRQAHQRVLKRSTPVSYGRKSASPIDPTDSNDKPILARMLSMDLATPSAEPIKLGRLLCLPQMQQQGSLSAAAVARWTRPSKAHVRDQGISSVGRASITEQSTVMTGSGKPMKGVRRQAANSLNSRDEKEQTIYSRGRLATSDRLETSGQNPQLYASAIRGNLKGAFSTYF